MMTKVAGISFFMMFAIFLTLSTELLAQGSKPLKAGKLDEVEGTATKYTYAIPKNIGGDFQFTRVQRDGDTITFEFTTNSNVDPNEVKKFKLAKADGPVPTSEHECRPVAGADKMKTTFQGEAFERIIPPTTEDAPGATPADPVAPLQITAKGGTFRLFVGKFTLQQASGRFYVNGEVHQVVTSFESKLKQNSTGKTFTWTARARAEYEDPVEKKKVTPTKMPRFDVKRTYPLQFRVFRIEGETKLYEAVVAIDTPGIFVPSNPKAYFGIRIEPDDEMTFDASFSTYFWEDCEADGTLSLATHRVDWKVHAELKHGNPAFFNSKGKSTKDNTTKVHADPGTGAGTPYRNAETNDPGRDNGWSPTPDGQLDRTES
jgi:hypothetical protein